MASKKRQEEFYTNHERYALLQKHFKFSFWASLIPSGGVFIIMTIYYMIRGLVLLAGASMIVGQKLANDITGETTKTGLGYTVPYLFMAFLFFIALLSFLGFFFKVKKPYYAVLGLHIAGAAYGLLGMIFNWCGVLMGLYLLAYGGFGIWLCDFIFRLYKEQNYLSLQEGYPDFIVVINEPRPMANTSGLHYKQSEYLKRQQKEKKEKGETASEAQNFEMDELTVDTELPKGTRKIDNMM